MDGVILWPGWPCFQFQILGLSDEIPRMVVGQFLDKGWTAHMTLCVVVCYLCDSLGSPKMNCRNVY